MNEPLKQSSYMEWAKTRSQARFNLATSGLTNVSFADFPVRLDQLEITTADGYGYPPLLERLKAHTGASSECIVTASGTSMANHLAMAALLHPGDEVLIEQPSYGLLLDVANYLQADVKRFQRRFEDGFGIDLQEIEKLVSEKTRLIVLTNLHNPTGLLIPAENIQSLGEIASRHGAKVLVDEVYLEMLFHGGGPFCFPIGESFPINPFIATSSLTKAYGLSGLRCGWILAPPELAHRMWRLNDLFAASPAHTAERLSVMAFDHLDEFRTRAKTLTATNRELLTQFLDSRTDLECVRPSAGTIAFPRLVHAAADKFFKLLREKYETTVVPGQFFEMPQHFRIGIGGDTSDLQAGLERISAALDEFA
jgi:aspartate/methionine/tyrosine aminotransferase